jgi:hypothetical protein
MHSTLAHWVSVPPTYDGLLLDSKKKGGALKRKASDIKIGPLLHATANHFDGDKVRVTVQVGVPVAGRGSRISLATVLPRLNSQLPRNVDHSKFRGCCCTTSCHAMPAAVPQWYGSSTQYGLGTQYQL